MRERQINAFNEMMRAVNAGDADRYSRLYAQDAVITIYGGDRLEGRGAIKNYEVELLREFPGTQLRFYDAWLNGADAVVHYAVKGKTAAGQPMGHEGLLFYRFDPSGLIAEERRYLDSLTPMAQLGMFGSQGIRALPKLPTEMRTHDAKGASHEAENVKVVRATLSALDSHDKKGFLSAFADNASFDELMAPEPYVGLPKAKAWYDFWISAIPDARTEITNLVGIDGAVLVESVVRGKLRTPFGRIPASDRDLIVHRAMIIQLMNGKVIRIWAFMNGKELAEATGSWPLPMVDRK